MTMAFKYQISLCARPNDILLVTLNHMDAIRDFVDSFGPIKEQVDNAYRLLLEVSLDHLPYVPIEIHVPIEAHTLF